VPSVKNVSNDRLYDAINSMRLELKADITDLRKQFDEEQLQIKQGVQEIEKQQQCIAAFFNQPPAERISNLKLSSLDVCKNVVKQ
jgi:DNA-binding protein H-NS